MKRIIGMALALGLIATLAWWIFAKTKTARDEPQVIFKRQSGDLAAFFLTQARHYGAHARTNAISELKTTWEFAPDADGFQILMAHADTEHLVQAVLVPAFGEPKRQSSYPHIYYYIPDIGVALSIGTNSDSNLEGLGTTNDHLICIRGETMLKELGVKN
jgi:hypothetical protein